MMPGTMTEALAARAADGADRLAFSIEGEAMTFGQLYDDAQWLARRLAAVGVTRRSRCAIILPTCLDLVRSVYAAQLLGAIPVVIDPGLTRVAHDLRLGLIDPSVVITTDQIGSQVRGAVAGTRAPTVVTRSMFGSMAAVRGPVGIAPEPEDIAYLQFTSGTSGDPRPSAMSYRALISALKAMEERYDLTAHDVQANWIPLHYTSGLVRHVFGTVSAGCPSYLIKPEATGIAKWLNLIARVRATVTVSPDFAFRLAARLVSASEVDLRSLRIATNGGEAVRASTIRTFEGHFGLTRVVQPAYGLSEAVAAVASTCPGDELDTDDLGHVSCGRAIAGVELRVVDECGAECAAGVEGQIQFRGDTLFSGYFGDEPGTRDVMRDGWCQPGDLGVLDGVGRLYVRSRVRAMIKRAGAGISPREIEEPVERLEGVHRAAAIGINLAGGSTEDIVVVVEVLDEHSPGAAGLASEVQRVAVAAVGVMPASVLIVPATAIPRTATGKVRLAELQALVGDPVFVRSAYFAG